MPFNKMNIYNIALRMLGDTRIDDITERSPGREKLDDVWDMARGLLLERHEWGFATRVKELAQLPDEDDPRWAYVYALPAGCVKVQRIEPEFASVQYGTMSSNYLYENTKRNFGGIPMEKREGKLYTDLDKVYLRFSYDVTDVSTFPAIFAYTLAFGLASMVATGTQGSFQSQAQYAQFAELWLGEGMAIDAGEMEMDHAQDLDLFNNAR